MTSKAIMTQADATEWVYNHDDSTAADPEELRAAFVALYGREPAGEAEKRDMWSFCCSATLGGGTRPATHQTT